MDADGVATGRRHGKALGFAVGVALFAAAIWVLSSRRADLADAWEAAATAPAWLVGLIVVLPLANWLAVSASLTLLSRRFGRVGHVEMATLTGSAWLLNYLPMRPGMIGRVTYHKRINGIRVKDSFRVLLESMACSGASIAAMSAIAWAAPLEGAALLAAVVSPVAVALAVAGALATVRPGAARIAGGLALRYVDVLIWAARYAAVFALIGHDLTLRQAVLAAAVSQAVLLVPLTGNGLGLREWAIDLSVRMGLLADVVNRAAEVLVALPVGLACGALVAKRLRRPDAPAPAGR